MKVRVIFKCGSFYPQYRKFFIWWNYETSVNRHDKKLKFSNCSEAHYFLKGLKGEIK